MESFAVDEIVMVEAKKICLYLEALQLLILL